MINKRTAAAVIALMLASAVFFGACADMRGMNADTVNEDSGYTGSSRPSEETTESEAPETIPGNTASEMPETADDEKTEGTINENTSAETEEIGTDTAAETEAQGEHVQQSAGAMPFWRGMLTDEAEIAAYDRLLTMVNELSSTAAFAAPITYDGLSRVFDLFALDHPEFFWGGGGYTASGSNGLVSSVSVSGGYSAESVYRMKAEIDGAADAIIASIPDGASEFEAERAIFDWLAKNVRYDVSAPNAYSIYGALAERRCVCEGFAEAFQYLCSRVGVEATSITGYADNGRTNDRHKWNAVRLDGNWYLVDPTWAVGNESFRYLYLNESGYILQSHFPDNALARYLPSFNALDMSYLNFYRLAFGDETFDETFLRALGHFKEIIDGGERSAVVLMRAETTALADKYIDIINDSRDARISGLLDEFNSSVGGRYAIAGNAGTAYGSVIFFSLYKR